MGRPSATDGIFYAIAEPRRRDILSFLADEKARAVGEIVEAMRLPQPTVSKHLAVLLAVGVVSVERMGKSRLYRLLPEPLIPVHDWTSQFERLWSRQLSRIKERAEKLAAKRAREN